MSYVVIDPGKTGAAVLLEGCQPIHAYAMRSQSFGIDVGDLREEPILAPPLWMGGGVARDADSEAEAGMPPNSSAVLHIVGQTMAAIYGVGSSIHEINPSTWTAFTKRLSHNPGADAKKQAQELCHRYFPEFVKDWVPKTKIHDGVADCLAISLYVNRDTYVDDIGGSHE